MPGSPFRTKCWLLGSPVDQIRAPDIGARCFRAMNLSDDYLYERLECATLTEGDTSAFLRILHAEDTLGICVTMPLKLQIGHFCKALDQRAQAIGSVNTLVWVDDLKGWLGTNNDTVGCLNPILTALTGLPSPFPSRMPRTFKPGAAAGFCIGAGGAIRAACWTLHEMGLSPIYIANRDPVESRALLAEGNPFNLIVLPLSVEEASQMLRAESRPIAVAVGAIPSTLPQTQAEQALYALIALVFARSYSSMRSHDEVASLALPTAPILLDLVYKPPMTRIRTLAETQGWCTLCGTEASAEIVFDQMQLWLGKEVPSETRAQIHTDLKESVG